jgi:hypothetical protein
MWINPAGVERFGGIRRRDMTIISFARQTYGVRRALWGLTLFPLIHPSQDRH